MPSNLPAPFGALLIGTWVNLSLYTLELNQVLYFFKHYRDPITIRCAVLGALLVDTVCAAASCACIYLYTITNWGNDPYLLSQYWPVPLYICTTGLTAAIVQAFLIYRIWVLSKNRLVTVALVLLATTAWISSIMTTRGLILFPEYAQRSNLVVPATFWFASSAGSDIAIAAALVWQLRGMKSGFKSTRSLVHRLMASALKTGSATAGIATVILALYLQDNQSNYATGVCFNMGRVYSLTMLYNLNTRKHGSHTGNSNGNTSSDVRQAPINLAGIQVSRSVHVAEDASTLGRARRNETIVDVDGKSSDEEYDIPNKAAPFASA